MNCTRIKNTFSITSRVVNSKVKQIFFSFDKTCKVNKPFVFLNYHSNLLCYSVLSALDLIVVVIHDLLFLRRVLLSGIMDSLPIVEQSKVQSNQIFRYSFSFFLKSRMKFYIRIQQNGARCWGVVQILKLYLSNVVHRKTFFV